jgi:hypothetical protein
MLAAEKFSSPLQIVIGLLNLIAHRTNCDAGRACNPSSLTISTFFAHTVQSGGSKNAFVAIRATSMKAPAVTPSTKNDSK